MEDDSKEEREDDADDEQSGERCAYCFEEIRHPLSCGCSIHMMCIIRSGSERCGLCRRPVMLTRLQSAHMQHVARQLQRQNWNEIEWSPHPGAPGEGRRSPAALRVSRSELRRHVDLLWTVHELIEARVNVISLERSPTQRSSDTL